MTSDLVIVLGCTGADVVGTVDDVFGFVDGDVDVLDVFGGVLGFFTVVVGAFVVVLGFFIGVVCVFVRAFVDITEVFIVEVGFFTVVEVGIFIVVFGFFAVVVGAFVVILGFFTVVDSVLDATGALIVVVEIALLTGFFTGTDFFVTGAFCVMGFTVACGFLVVTLVVALVVDVFTITGFTVFTVVDGLVVAGAGLVVFVTVCDFTVEVLACAFSLTKAIVLIPIAVVKSPNINFLLEKVHLFVFIFILFPLMFSVILIIHNVFQKTIIKLMFNCYFSFVVL
ncbi:hypothetical protein [Staphylococcus sp. GDH8C109P]|uniref:hypothetical protein n=1 Tax=Staphylococcus sp. GDH8C109P TaxID=2804088 RepID=UPI001FD9DF24|nr:hypothetical protein [Staphylococcus sp. GDH8C109P]